MHPDVQARGSERLGELFEAIHPRPRLGRLEARVGTHGGQQLPQFPERLPTRRFDRAQCRARLIRAGIEHVVGRRGLHDDDRHAVRDHVVELPGDACLLVARRPARRLVDCDRAIADHLAECPGHDRDDQREQRVLVRRREDVRRREGQERGERRQRDARWPQCRKRGEREDAGVGDHAGRSDQLDAEPAGEGDRHHALGVPSPPPQGDALGDRKHDAHQLCRPALDGRIEHDRDQHQAHRERDRDVGDLLQPGAAGSAHTRIVPDRGHRLR